MAETPNLPQPVADTKEIISGIQGKEFKSALDALLIHEFMSTDRFVKLLFNAIRSNPKLARCDKTSMIGAMMMAAAFNVEPNTPSQQCFIIPRNKSVKIDGRWEKHLEASFQFGYRGLIEIAYRSPRLVVMQAEEIHQNDRFVRKLGSQTLLEFEQARRDRGALDGVFCYMKFMSKSGVEAEDSTYLDIQEIEKIRNQSETWKTILTNIAESSGDEYKENKAKKAMEDAAWQKWEGQMGIKSAIKRQMKKMPLSPEMKSACEIDDAGEIGRLMLKNMKASDVKSVVAEGDSTLLIEEQPAETVAPTIPTTESAEKIPVKQEGAPKQEQKPKAQRKQLFEE